MNSVSTGEPIVRLIAYTAAPYDVAIASARTCYSPKAILPGEVTEGQRERIGPGIYSAGHHTPFQHATFTFAIENVSRNLVWGFLHGHPYYNSDEMSQRYNVLPEPRVYVPPLGDAERRIYEDAVSSAWSAYNGLLKTLTEKNLGLMASIGKVKGQNEKQIQGEAEKKAAEMARYVLPICAFASLYHTISGVVLKRYIRMANSCGTPTEARAVVERMVEEVRKVDPQFIGRIPEETILVEKLPENSIPVNPGDYERFAEDFDSLLEGHSSKLVSSTPKAEELVAEGVREALGVAKAQLPDDEAIDLAVNPAKNPHLLATLNTWQNSPVMKALNHPAYTFKKKISHTADCQDTRHRTTPASRPLLPRCHTAKPDYMTPKIISEDAGLRTAFDDAMKTLWEAKNRLLENGVSPEFAVYLLPNATALRFTESGRFIDLMHKWRMRTCFNAQEEIYDVSMEELAQVSAIHPRLTKYIGPPCFFRRGLVEGKGKEGPCPEGPRWCGIDVWRNFPKVKRPF